MRPAVRSTALALAALLAGGSASAQVGAPAARTGFSLTPYIGVLAPTKDLPDYNGEVTKLKAAITFGGRLGVPIGSRIGIEGDIGYSPGSLEASGGGADLNTDVIEAGTDVGGVAGVSAGIRVGRLLAVNVGVEDYLYNASFDVSGAQTSGRSQHDLRFTGGLRIPLIGF